MYYNLLYPNYTFAHKYDENPTVNDEFDYHVHMIYELFYFIQGKANFIIENKKYGLLPGDLLFIPPGYHHNIDLDFSVPYERYVLKFPEYAIPKSLMPYLKQSFGSYKTDSLPLPKLFEDLDYHFQNYKGIDLFGLMCCKLNEILYFFCDDTEPYEFDVYDEDMKDIIDYINENISKNFTLNDLAERFHFSKSYICKKFKNCMNAPIMKYIRTKKILLAESLIRQNQRPSDIYQQCGFTDYSTFYRAYKNMLGVAPTDTE